MYGYVKVAAANFTVKIADVESNVSETVRLIKQADAAKVELIVFPELSITGYTCADIFGHDELLRQAESGLERICKETKELGILICVGMPIMDHARVFNCAVYVQSGQILGAVPKTYIPNYNEFYEKRWFVSASCRIADSVCLCGGSVPFSEKLLIKGQNGVVIGTEICEDLWVDNPPSGMLSRAGATIIVNPSASNDIIGKRAYRRNLVTMQSARCRAGYVYASAGAGESSTDIVFSGHNIIADNGHLVAEASDVFATENMIIGLIDVQRSVHDKAAFNSDTWGMVPRGLAEVEANIPRYGDALPEEVDAYPFVPKDESSLNERCDEILSLQAKGLIQRLRATGIKKSVVGISGGLDSTLALIVTCIAYDKLGWPRSDIYAITMPGFGTSTKTKGIADDLMEQLGVTYKTVDIKPACKQHLADLGHSEDVLDITYENTQARERTQILFDYANMINGLLIGTGDMSEMALGWCTYNGDHMSNYAVNVGVPKTLVKYLVRAYAIQMKKLEGKEELYQTLMEVFDLPISPELLPTDSDGNIAQKTEESIGKYDLHDFFLYHYLRNGCGRDKIYALACIAFPQVDKEEIGKTLDTFFWRFRTQQFKRSCIPDGVKIGTVALSPRGDLRLPSDLGKLV